MEPEFKVGDRVLVEGSRKGRILWVPATVTGITTFTGTAPFSNVNLYAVSCDDGRSPSGLIPKVAIKPRPAIELLAEIIRDQ